MDSKSNGTNKRSNSGEKKLNPKKAKDLNTIIANKYEELTKSINNLPPQLRKDLKLAQSNNKPVLQVVESDLTTIYKRITSMREQLVPLTHRETLLTYDLSGGRAPIPIPCYNEIDDASPPKNFEWIEERKLSDNIPHNPMSSEFITGCSCEGDTCGSALALDCSCCNESSNHELAYLNGKLNTKSIYITECNVRCECDPTKCPNRVVQNQAQYPVEVFRTIDSGWGVRASVDIPKGSYICEYTGKIIDNDTAERLGLEYDDQKCSYLYDLDLENDAEEEHAYVIDAKHYGNVSRFLNHSCGPNLEKRCVFINVFDKRFPHIAFFTAKDISKGEELTFDYQYTKNSYKIPCSCGSKNCKIWLM